MSEELENSVREKLNETWITGSGTNNKFTQNNLNDLADILNRAREENCENAVKEICDETLTHQKNNIVALYFSGMIGLRNRSLDNSALVSLVDIFEKNYREVLVEQLCLSILAEDPQNKFAMRKLAEYYKNNNNDKVWELFEQIVKIDLEEADIAKLLAERYEKQNNKEEAIKYYKKALQRFEGARNGIQVQEIWNKLVELIPDKLEFFLQEQRKIAKTISEDKSAELMKKVYTYYKDTANWQVAISILKLILSIDKKDSACRAELVECYRAYYADHTHVEEYIQSSNLEKSFRDVDEAINDFEKHIAFDAKNYVFHRSWGVGIIRKVEGDKLDIFFGKKIGSKGMTLKMAVSALEPLPKDHIWVKRATTNREELTKWVKSDITGTLKTIIKSFNNNCDDKRIKAELVDSKILTQGEWTSWHSKAQKILETDPSFGVNPNDINMYSVLDHPLTLEERLSSEFSAEKQFFPRIAILMRYVNDENTDKNDEAFADMFKYFADHLKSINKVDEQIVASFLVTQEISKRLPGTFAFPATFTFKAMYDEIQNPRKMYVDLKESFLKEAFLFNIKQLPDWDSQFIELFPTVLKKDLILLLLSNGKEEKVERLVHDSFEEYRTNRDAVIYLFKECRNEEWFTKAGISYERQLVTLVNIISLCGREIENHVNTTENKKTIKMATQLLFEDKVSGEKVNNMLNFIQNSDVEVITRMYTMVNDVKDLDSVYKGQLRSGILSKYPDFKFQEAEIKQEAPKGLIVTEAMRAAKVAEADRIEKVELPDIQQHLNSAVEKGDLSENADYTAYKEERSKANLRLTKIKEELSRAVVFDPSTVTTSIISFGTTVTLQNNLENREDVFTILGPWESDAEKGIISYLSPLGDKLLNARVGENLQFEINERKYDFIVKSIVAAKI